MRDAWFRPKTYGYGAYPAHWKGWAAVLVYVVALTAEIAATLSLARSGGEGSLSLGWFALGVAGALVGTGAFIALCAKKSSEPWRWRWGSR
ncbi:MAG: hypothetical protein R3A48_05865 [Polyangiales bacterium]